MTYPCWLKADQREQAQALLDLGFHYCGNEDEFCRGWLVCKVHGWTFRSASGEICLDAICNGALYSWCLETMPDHDTDGFFETRVKEAKTAISKVVKLQETRVQTQAKQLLLFG